MLMYYETAREEGLNEEIKMTKDDIRYSRISDILQLLYMMMAEPNGISLDDICDEFSVSRRTAERMRDSLTNIFSQIGVINDDEKIKRWGFINYSLKEVVEFTDKEIAAMEVLKQNFRTVCIPEIDSIIDKMKILRNNKKV